MNKCPAHGCDKPSHEPFYMCEYHFGVICGDHLVPVKDCGCEI